MNIAKAFPSFSLERGCYNKIQSSKDHLFALTAYERKGQLSKYGADLTPADQSWLGNVVFNPVETAWYEVTSMNSMTTLETPTYLRGLATYDSSVTLAVDGFSQVGLIEPLSLDTSQFSVTLIASREERSPSPSCLFLYDLTNYVGISFDAIPSIVQYIFEHHPYYLYDFRLTPAPLTSRIVPMNAISDVQYVKGRANEAHLSRLESEIVFNKSKRD